MRTLDAGRLESDTFGERRSCNEYAAPTSKITVPQSDDDVISQGAWRCARLVCALARSRGANAVHGEGETRSHGISTPTRRRFAAPTDPGRRETRQLNRAEREQRHRPTSTAYTYGPAERDDPCARTTSRMRRSSAPIARRRIRGAGFGAPEQARCAHAITGRRRPRRTATRSPGESCRRLARAGHFDTALRSFLRLFERFATFVESVCARATLCQSVCKRGNPRRRAGCACGGTDAIIDTHIRSRPAASNPAGACRLGEDRVVQPDRLADRTRARIGTPASSPIRCHPASPASSADVNARPGR